MSNKELRMWVDLGLLISFPATVLTGVFHGPRWMCSRWHLGWAIILVVLILAHLWLNEDSLRAVLRRLSQRLHGADPEARCEDIELDD